MRTLLAIMLLAPVVAMADDSPPSVAELRKKGLSELRTVTEELISDNAAERKTNEGLTLSLKSAWSEIGAIKVDYSKAYGLAASENLRANDLVKKVNELRPRFLRARNICVASAAVGAFLLGFFLSILITQRLRSEWRWFAPILVGAVLAGAAAATLLSIL